MKAIKFSETFVGDFETTVFEEQEYTEVWASALVKINTENVLIHNRIEDTFEYLKSLKRNVLVYYHNLKFDGQFWLSFLMTKTKLKNGYYLNGITAESVSFYEKDEMPNNSFIYSISHLGQWYSITIKTGNHYIEFRDSLKLLPFSVKAIGKAFKTKHQKLTMEYEGVRWAGCEISPEEKEYIANDVLVVKEALEIMFKQGHKKMTIGSCCKAEFKRKWYRRNDEFKHMFPDLTLIKLDREKYGSDDVDEYVRKSYKGGWCYLAKGKEEKLFSNGTTADVNSLYPSVMSSESGNKYPVMKPTFWKGNFIPVQALGNDKFYFIRIRTEFRLKPNKLPCIQVKHNPNYLSTEWLETSDINYPEITIRNKHYSAKRIRNKVELTLTEMDFELINEQYDLIDLEILDGCFFNAYTGLFDEYIEKYKNIKLKSEGAMRTLAKLFLNNLYGKFAASRISSFKYAYVKEDGSIGFKEQTEFDKETFFIPIGSAVTSYARNFTIRAAQQNYYGANERGFIYADTDSIHCDLLPNEIKGIKVHESNFLHWKLETCWDKGWFVRQKTYIEHVTAKDLTPIDTPYYNIVCAGMSEDCKRLYQISMSDNVNQWIEENREEYNAMHEVEKDYIKTHREMTDFKDGFYAVGKLAPKTIKGGVILCQTTFQIRKQRSV